MRDGGSQDGSDSSGAGEADGAGAGPGGRSGLLRKHWLVVSAVALVVLAAGVTIPLVLTASDDSGPDCYDVTAPDRALAADPRAATEALDPGDDLARIGMARRLLGHENVCGDGAQVLGRIVEGATRSAGPGKPHTMEQARAAYAVAAAVHDLELPQGLAPGIVRMVADYVVDAGRDHYRGREDEAPGPAVPPEMAQPDSEGRTKFGRFLAPDEAHPVFEYVDNSLDVEADMESLVSELSKDPEAFAILYEAERANFAHYLERLTDDGGDPGFRPRSPADSLSTGTAGPDNDLKDMAGRIGSLMKHRARSGRDRTIVDLAAFDRSVRRHTRGTFRPAGKQLDSRPVMGDIANRPVSGPLEGDLMDGRHQLFTVLDEWVKERGVAPQRAASMKQQMDDAYVRALWMGF